MRQGLIGSLNVALSSARMRSSNWTACSPSLGINGEFKNRYLPSYAFCIDAISNFFIGKNACVIRSICSRVPSFIISPITVGQTC